MKKIVIIGAGEFQVPLILKAKEMNFETHVFAWEKGAVGKEIADFFYPISITDKESILSISKKLNPAAVVSVASDLAVITVNYVARALGLPCNPPETDYNATNKYLMRKNFQQAGITVPRFVKVQENFSMNILNEMAYPLIVKPTDRSGSRAICEVSNDSDLKKAVHAAIKESFEKCAIIEEVIIGNEYSCESITQNGIHHILAFTKKYTTGAPDFIEEAHLEPSDLSNTQKNIISEEIKRALDALHIETGASHTEFRVDANGNIKIIEIGARMGGDYIGTHLVPLSTGYDYLKMVIQAACGEQIDLSCWGTTKTAYAKFIMNQNDKEMFNSIRNDKANHIVYETEIENPEDHKVVDSSSRFGAFIMQCTTSKELSLLLEKYSQVKRNL